MMRAPRLESRSPQSQLLRLFGVPIAWGLATGVLLDVSEIAYGIAFLGSLVPGVVACREHVGRLACTLRGLLFGTLLGIFILFAHTVVGGEAKGELPDPEISMILLTAAMFGVFGLVVVRMREFIEPLRSWRASRAEKHAEEGAVEQSD
ncbi:MAG TPA: hypothetical protein VFX45_02790 [Solirubrobacterales bacterium]|nr:hypothetical protein [Solirubrobacterales bacterium]